MTVRAVAAHSQPRIRDSRAVAVTVDDRADPGVALVTGAAASAQHRPTVQAAPISVSQLSQKLPGRSMAKVMAIGCCCPGKRAFSNVPSGRRA